MNRHPLALAALLGASLCALPLAAQTDTAGTPTPESPRPSATQQRLLHPRRSLNAINYEEFRDRHFSDAYEIVHDLRPSWLRTPRGATSINAQGDLAVYMDGIRMGSREALHAISVTSVRSLRFFSAVDARQRFGGDTSVGAVEVYSQD